MCTLLPAIAVKADCLSLSEIGKTKHAEFYVCVCLKALNWSRHRSKTPTECTPSSVQFNSAYSVIRFESFHE